MATSPTPRAKAATAATAAKTAAAPKVAPAPVVSPPVAAAPVTFVTSEHAESVAQAQTAALKSYEDVVGFSKDALEALVESSTVLSRGLQDIGSKFFGLAQAVM